MHMVAIFAGVLVALLTALCGVALNTKVPGAIAVPAPGDSTSSRHRQLKHTATMLLPSVAIDTNDFSRV